MFSHSKGRVPDVFVFTPDTETVIGRGLQSHTPPKSIAALRSDLEAIPMFLARSDDVILVTTPPEPTHLAELKRLDYTVPEFVVTDLNRRTLPPQTSLANRQLGRCHPWGWDHRTANFLQPIAENFRDHAHSFSEIVESRIHFSSKAWLAQHLPDWLQSLPDAYAKQCVMSPLPQSCEDLQQLAEQVKHLQVHGYDCAVAKAPFGAAGHGQQRIRDGKLSTQQETWVKKLIATQGSVVVEPWYEKEVDLSWLFHRMPDNTIRDLGLSRFYTDDGGRYRGTQIGHLKHGMPSHLKDFIYRAGGRADWIAETAKHMVRCLLPSLERDAYEGHAGLDLMIVRDASGSLKLRVPLELNARPTMGHVAKAIGRPLGTRACGVWLLVNHKDLNDTQYTTFDSLLTALQSALPMVKPMESGGISQGIFTTNSVHQAKAVIGLCIVAKEFSTVESVLRTHLGNKVASNLMPKRHISTQALRV